MLLHSLINYSHVASLTEEGNEEHDLFRRPRWANLEKLYGTLFI
jgi:hypothetical protein